MPTKNQIRITFHMRNTKTAVTFDASDVPEILRQIEKALLADHKTMIVNDKTSTPMYINLTHMQIIETEVVY